jgi:hypothetical protein
VHDILAISHQHRNGHMINDFLIYFFRGMLFLTR